MKYIKVNSGTAFTKPDKWRLYHAEQTRQDLALLGKGQTSRCQFVGGSTLFWIRQAYPVDLIDAIDFTIDNTQEQWSGSADVVVPITFYLRCVSWGSTAVTPRVWNVTKRQVAPLADAFECFAFEYDWSGLKQKQVTWLTLASGVNTYRVQQQTNNGNNPVMAMAWLGLHI